MFTNDAKLSHKSYAWDEPYLEQSELTESTKLDLWEHKD